jgi:general secretion pathway protein H
MPTSEAGSKRRLPHPLARPAFLRRSLVSGFTLLELLIVVAIIAIASAGVSFALRDPSQTRLEREAQRLAALLESARARSRATGVLVQWRPTPEGFVFDGLPEGELPSQWLASDIQAQPARPLLLGPEPIVGAQAVDLSLAGNPERHLRIATDGVRPFAVQPPAAEAGQP